MPRGPADYVRAKRQPEGERLPFNAPRKQA